MKRILWTIFILVVGGYLGLTLLVYLMQERFVYSPRKEIGVTPDLRGLEYESVAFTTSDGIGLSGWFMPAADRRGTVLFCHGNGGNISHTLEAAELYHKLRLDVLVFDYRGYGNSQGTPSEEGTYRDAKAAWEYLVSRRNVAPSEILLVGRSLGGAVATWLAGRHTPRAMIIESTFTSVPDIGANRYPILPVRLLSRFSYNNIENIRSVHSPVLIVHSTADEIIPFDHGKRLFQAANEPKEFLEIMFGHNDGYAMSGDRYTRGITSFVERWMMSP